MTNLNNHIDMDAMMSALQSFFINNLKIQHCAKLYIKNKQICYRNLSKSRYTKSFEKYKLAKKEIRAKVYKDISHRLESKDEEKYIYRIARMREKKTRDLGTIRCINGQNHKVLVKDKTLKKYGRNILTNSSMVITFKMLVM